MIHPSYYELMEKINSENEADDNAPVITSRYSIVLATSKRARQLTDGAEPKTTNESGKLLSIAVDELYQGLVNIVADDETSEEEAEGEEAAKEEE